MRTKKSIKLNYLNIYSKMRTIQEIVLIETNLIDQSPINKLNNKLSTGSYKIVGQPIKIGDTICFVIEKTIKDIPHR